MAYYVETSALAKLVLNEAETPALLSWLTDQTQTPATSSLARAELLRTVNQHSPGQADHALEILDSITVMRLTSDVLTLAGTIKPDALRTLDAIHLAAALDLEDDLEGMVTYDTRLAEAANLHGITVITPGGDRSWDDRAC